MPFLQMSFPIHICFCIAPSLHVLMFKWKLVSRLSQYQVDLESGTYSYLFRTPGIQVDRAHCRFRKRNNTRASGSASNLFRNPLIAS